MAETDAVPALTLADCHRSDLRGMRRWLRGHPLDEELAVDAALVATELATNALEHGTGAVGVRIAVRDAYVVVEVDDEDPAGRLTLGRSRLDVGRGRGLTLVDAAAAWGVVRTSAGKSVWAVVGDDRHAPSVPAGFPAAQTR